MPDYAVQCDDCEEPFELFVRSVHAPPKAVCPTCGREHVKKEVTVFAAPGIGSTGAASSTAACAPSRWALPAP